MPTPTCRSTAQWLMARDPKRMFSTLCCKHLQPWHHFDSIMASYIPATGHTTLDPSFYPLVAGEPDEKAAFDAYSSYNSLLDYRALRLPDSPFLCPINLEQSKHDTYTFAQTRRLVISAARTIGSYLPPRKSGEDQKVIGLVGISGGDYWLNDKALQRL